MDIFTGFWILDPALNNSHTRYRVLYAVQICGLCIWYTTLSSEDDFLRQGPNAHTHIVIAPALIKTKSSGVICQGIAPFSNQACFILC